MPSAETLEAFVQMEELAWQRWEAGKIAEETFFCDQGQLVPKPAA